tara:strand:+ start:4893 stop:5660 length:768 start_codon:yes stop_codon:yes gene_type:complete
MNIDAKKIVLELIDTFKLAGDLSIKLRKDGLIKEIKKDNTPVTNGDIEVNKILTEKISKVTPNIAIVSEETSVNKNKVNLKNFWLIDPIDGTSDYINNKDEFTLNAALIINNKPALGLINAPAKNRMFYSYGNKNSFEVINNKEINLSKNIKKNKEFVAVHYSNSLKPEIQSLHEKFNIKKFYKMKSSLKFCVLAAGEFDFYFAEPRANEWDIAAGHAILEHSGGKLTDFDGNEILYGKPNFKNPSLILRSKNIL